MGTCCPTCDAELTLADKGFVEMFDHCYACHDAQMTVKVARALEQRRA